MAEMKDQQQGSGWAKLGGNELEACLQSGAVALVNAKFLINLAAEGARAVLPPRQCLPDDAFLSLDQLKKLAAKEGVEALPIVCASHMWATPTHPDPTGFNLRLLADQLQAMLDYETVPDELGVFVDFCSMFQACRDKGGAPQPHAFKWLKEPECLADGAVGRTAEEERLFREGLGNMSILFSHPRIFVLLLTAAPPGADGAAMPKYESRGWCAFERAVAALVKPVSYVLDLHLLASEQQLGAARPDGVFWASPGDGDLHGGRRPPLTPDEFAEELKTKKFTNGREDRPKVMKLYEEAVANRIGQAKALYFSGLGWGDAEAAQLARVLAQGHAPLLKSLSLLDNAISDEGAKALAGAIAAVPQLEALNLNVNRVGDEAARALLAALSGRPLRIQLAGNPGVRDETRQALEQAWEEAFEEAFGK